MTLPTEKRTLLTVITEKARHPRFHIGESLLPANAQLFDRLGVRGYTVWDARGRGNRGMRDGSWEESANIRIEMVCPRSQAEAVLGYLQARYYADYAMVGFLQDVEVLRPGKF